MDEGVLPKHKPFFFREKPHPLITSNDMLDAKEPEFPLFYELIEGEGDNKGYWERRENKDWSDLPKLWDD